MATISLPRPVPAHRSSSPSRDDALNLDATNSTTTRPIPIPNKHIPDCPTGPRPDRGPTPPPSPPQHCRADLQPHSLLYPPTQYAQIPHMDIPVYHITPAGVAAALRHIATIPLPDPSKVFPWFHGLHPQNRVQESFFFQRKKGFKRYPTPDCFRAITLVKANGDLSTQLLKGAIRADEFLHKFKEKDASGTLRNCFKDIDPKDGFSVRNFQIQAAKVAMLSDIVVYGSDEVECKRLARDIAEAQTLWLDAPGRSKGGKKIPFYNTFVCTAPFSHFEEGHADVVVVDSNGELTGAVTDFFHQERLEMAIMTKASEIATNVWLGPTPDASLGSNGGEYDLLIECSDHGQLNAEALKDLVMKFDDYQHPKCIEFPSSGSIMPPTWTPGEAEDIVESCRWIYNLAQGIRPVSHAGWAERGANETSTFSATPRKILIHCADGYTESTMFAIAYYIFAHGVPVSKAWLELHTEKKRNFFAYPSDVALLNAISPALLSASPTKPHSTEGITRVIQCEPEWLQKMDGSLPSRITDYMYLGNLGHANNPELLRELGIGQVLSIGEVRNWIPEDEGMGAWEGRVLLVQRVQDNGVDELTEDMERCLAFIGMFSPSF